MTTAAIDHDARPRGVHPSVRASRSPEGFQRIRYYGFLANRYRAEKLALCRQLLQTPPPAPNVEVKKDYRDRYEEITGVSLKTCPLCRHGTMIVIETFECAASREPRMDTS